MSVRDEYVNRLVTRAMKDEAFRQSLLTDPKQTIEQEFGISIPEGIEIVVHEESADTLHLVLPSQSDNLDRPLTEKELEALAGGAGLPICWNSKQPNPGRTVAMAC